MCLATPLKLKKVKGAWGYAEKKKEKINLSLLKTPKAGDWILVNNNLAIQKIRKKEAEEILELIKCSCAK